MMGNYHARCGVGEKPEVVTPEAYLSLFSSSYIGDKMEVVPPKIIEVGKIATVRTSPSVKKNTELGFLLGLVACAAIVVILAVMDDTIKTEEDIEKYLGISVLAKVPDRKDFVNKKSNKRNRR